MMIVGHVHVFHLAASFDDGCEDFRDEPLEKQLEAGVPTELSLHMAVSSCMFRE